MLRLGQLLGHANPVPAFMLGAIERIIRRLEEIGRLGSVCRIDRDAERGGGAGSVWPKCVRLVSRIASRICSARSRALSRFASGSTTASSSPP